MNLTAKELTKKIISTLSAASNKNKAVGMKAYMKDQYEYLGITAPVRRELYKSI